MVVTCYHIEEIREVLQHRYQRCFRRRVARLSEPTAMELLASLMAFNGFFRGKRNVLVWRMYVCVDLIAKDNGSFDFI